MSLPDMGELSMIRVVRHVALSAMLAFCFGCEDDEIEYRPPTGQAAIGIDNNSSSDIEVYIDGEKKVTVGDWSEKAFDLEPGVYRLVLRDEDYDDRSYSSDIDLIEDNLTEVTVTTSTRDVNEFDVTIAFKD
jgi:hypothetical protein